MRKPQTVPSQVEPQLRAVALASVAALSLLSPAESLAGPTSKRFKLQVSLGAQNCLPEAQGKVKISAGKEAERMKVKVWGLPPNTAFDVFVIQVPEAPFGLSWYQGDIETNGAGTGAATFVGRFSSETFIVAPGAATVPDPKHPTDAPAGTQNPVITAPIHTYHIGIWFNSPADAALAGCPSEGTTPFNGDHTAGIQVLNTAQFAPERGPLRSFSP